MEAAPQEASQTTLIENNGRDAARVPRVGLRNRRFVVIEGRPSRREGRQGGNPPFEEGENSTL